MKHLREVKEHISQNVLNIWMMGVAIDVLSGEGGLLLDMFLTRQLFVIFLMENSSSQDYYSFRHILEKPVGCNLSHGKFLLTRLLCI